MKPLATDRPVGFLEFGNENDSWWKKAHQCEQYVDTMVDRMTRPVLMAVITYERSSSKPPPKRQKNDEGENDGDAEEEHVGDDDVGRDPLNFKIAAFLCWKETPTTTSRKEAGNSLLWRIRGTGVDDFTNHLAAVFTASCALRTWHHRMDLVKDQAYKDLGPNCCKVALVKADGNREERVLRCYDSRFCGTDRKADLYFNTNLQTGMKAKDAVAENGSIVNHDYCLKLIQDDGSETLPSFGPEVAYGKLDGNWLWRLDHAILVMSIPFFEGSHAATHPTDFLPIIKFLHNLHARGLAHGDVCGFNILFVDDQNGHLIDLDFAGEAGKAKYPRCYESALIDGIRNGEENELIQDDGSETLPSFGPEVAYGKLDGNWLWRPDHAILVLSIPFYEGSHAATHPTVFLPIIKFLHNLHVRGLAHGDVRGFNILFADHQHGHLIDLDFVGEAGKAKYPLGYVSELFDGVRNGEENAVLQAGDDWSALHNIMFTVHQFSCSDDRNMQALASCKNLLRTLEDEQDSGVCDKLESDLIIFKLGEVTTCSVWERKLAKHFRKKLWLAAQGNRDGATRGRRR